MGKKMTLIFMGLMILFALGCGDPSVSGKVLFPDGTPVSKGKVYFENGSFSATGSIGNDGSYSMGKTKDGDGIPQGNYKIAIMGAITQEFPENKIDPDKVKLGGVSVYKPVITRDLVHRKYTSVSTSGLELEVKGSMKHDIIVEPPTK